MLVGMSVHCSTPTSANFFHTHA